MKLKEIYRTSTFAWSHSSSASLPLLATGTVAGALDESFSNESQLEIWAPDFLDRDEFYLGVEGQHGPKGQVKDNARFNRLAWGHVDANRPHGVIAAGLENGELALWDPAKILAGENTSQSLILRNSTHTGPVRGLDFNPIQTNLLASGGINGEVYVWDLKDPSKPYSPTPGARSTKLDEITSVAWNRQVQYVLAGASSTGYTVVWDLRGKREVVALAYGGGAGTLAGQVGSGTGMAVGGRRGMSDIAWHPDNATRVVTASEDDSSPIIMVWDLRNARAPEKILTGHEKGVLSLSWCKQDADLLLSCGKDNRALCWNPQTSEVIGEFPSADNWAFQVDWCPRNPDILATAFFDGTIGIHSIQSTNGLPEGSKYNTARPDGADIFDAPSISSSSQSGTLSLKQPPKWLRRPISSAFGFGGKLVTVSNLASSQGKSQSSVVHIPKVVTETELVARAKKLQAAIDGNSLQTFAEEGAEGEGWKALLSLFKANSRDELVTLLGFSKSEIASRVAEAVENLKASAAKSPFEDQDTGYKRHGSVVSFAEPERETLQSDPEEDESAPPAASEEKTPSEVSVSVTSDTASAVLPTDGESATTGPSLFGDDIPGTPQVDAGHDFFNTVGVAQQDGESHPIHVPHTNYGLDSSVAATTGSNASSVTSEFTKTNGFRIYPSEESDVDRLVTKALVLGDFDSAVALCLSCDRFADAILLAVRGGPELLQRTQKAYFERRTTSSPSLRLFQSIVTNDLADIVQNADLREWREIFVVLCTFASQDEFSTLAEQLGKRLEYEFTVAQGSDDQEAEFYRKNATLTYLAAARLERLVSIWADELAEEEKARASNEKYQTCSPYSAHVHALQTFVEKVTVFRAATNYNDQALTQPSANVDDPAQTFKLAALYDRYFEYADVLCTQGLVKEAVKFLQLTPSNYKGSTPGSDFSSERQRLIDATTTTTPTAPVPVPTTVKIPPTIPAISGVPVASGVPATISATSTARPTGYGYTGYPAPVQPAAPQQQQQQQQPKYGHYEPSSISTTNPYGQPVQHNTSTYAVQPNAPNSLTQPPHLRHQQPSVPAPRAANGPPPPPKREGGGWNDAPAAVPPPSRVPAALPLNKPAAITSPFPNASPSPGYSPQPSPYVGQGPTTLPPPPRPGSVTGGQAPPPRPGSVTRGQAPPTQGPPPVQRLPPQGPSGHFPVRPPSQPGPAALPPRTVSSPQGQISLPQREPTPSQYAPPPSRTLGQSLSPGPGQQQRPPSGQPYIQARPVPPSGGPGGAPRSTATPPVRAPPPPPKYPAGDRSHIPDYVRPAFEIISENLDRIKRTTPNNQRLVDDLERRINPLFDALNCDTLSKHVVDQLLVLTKAMENRDRPAALAIHVDLLTRGSVTDDIGLWMSGIKQLILRL